MKWILKSFGSLPTTTAGMDQILKYAPSIQRELYMHKVQSWRLWRPRAGSPEVHLLIHGSANSVRTLLRFSSRQQLTEFRDKLTGIIRSIDNGKLSSDT